MNKKVRIKEAMAQLHRTRQKKRKQNKIIHSHVCDVFAGTKKNHIRIEKHTSTSLHSFTPAQILAPARLHTPSHPYTYKPSLLFANCQMLLNE